MKWAIKIDRIDVGEATILRTDLKDFARATYKSTLTRLLNVPSINDTMLRSIELVELEEVDEFLMDGGTVLSKFTWHRSAEADDTSAGCSRPYHCPCGCGSHGACFFDGE